jgi:hypothetical protein
MSFYTSNGEPEDYELLIELINHENLKPGMGGTLLTPTHLLDDPNFISVGNQVRSFVSEMWRIPASKGQAWGVKMGPGAEAAEHDHRHTDITALYYLTAGAPIGLQVNGRWFNVQPNPGLMLTFPGDMTHRVRPSKEGELTRYAFAMAFNR